MNLRSDNEAPAADELIQALIRANQGPAHAYGGDDWSGALDECFSEVFQRQARVFPVASGVAANALCLAQASPPWGAVFCHEEAHIQVDECGAVQFYGGGTNLLPLAGEHGRLAPETLAERIESLGVKGDHDPRPAALSLTQATECGTVYSADHLAALCGLAREHGMFCHMDGARLANAVAHLECEPADITWRGGIDLLSLGVSKNGGAVGEAAVFFDLDLAAEFGRRRMKGGHLVGKMRFLSAQLLAYLEDGLWLRLAGRANAGARRLAAALDGHDEARLAHPVEANEVFVHLSDDLNARLQDAGVRYHPWPGTPGLYRMVSSWAIDEGELERFEALLR